MGVPSRWPRIRVDVIRAKDDAVVGSYERNYGTAFKTFHSFELRGKQLALYSPDYTATRVMELPSCRDLGGEPRNPFGFCPTEYLVPEGLEFGFVAGCYWGEDYHWKIQYLDLSRADEGIIIRDNRFGYIELPDNLTLSEAVQMHKEPWILEHWKPGDPEWTVSFAVQLRYRIDTGERILDTPDEKPHRGQKPGRERRVFPGSE